MLKDFYQKGSIPAIIIILLAIIGISGVLIIKNIPINQSQPTPDKGFQESKSRVKSTPSPTISQTKPKSTPTPTQKNTPTPTQKASPTPTTTPTTTPSPFVTVAYPNGGESFKVGDNITVTWNTNMTLGSCQMQTIDSNNSGTVIGNYVNVTNRSISWTATIGSTTSTEKQLKIYMICYDFNGGTLFAKSNDYFTVSK